MQNAIYERLPNLSGLYLPSTPLNILISCAHALQFSGEGQRELWLIDQKQGQPSHYAMAIKDWRFNPFSHIDLYSEASGGLRKWRQRKAVFKEMERRLEEFTPEFVAVGSDRRIEFQFIMHCLAVNACNPLGVYLDDGLYSYSGRAQVWWKDRLNAGLKKLVYGSWWEEPETVGSSSLIDVAWLFKPETRVTQLAEKIAYPIPSEWFRSPEILSLSQRVAETLGYDLNRLSSADVVLLIAHPNNIQKISGYRDRLVETVKRLSAQGKNVAVKYHPRSLGTDSLRLLETGAQEIIPSAIAFEFVLPMFKSDILIVGDVGTSVFTSKWLRPDARVKAVLNKQDPFQNRFVSLSEAFGVSVVESVECI